MRVVTTLILTVGLAALVADSALAQQPPGGGRRGGQPPGGRGFGGGMMNSPAALLMIPEVQKELKLTDEQQTELKKFTDPAAMRERMQQWGPKFQEAQGDREKMQALFREMQAETEKELAKALKPEQMKRLKELVLQRGGALAAARDKELAGKLKLTDEQVSKLTKIQEELDADLRELRGPGGGGPPDSETQKKMAAARKEAMTKAMGVLTDEQRKSWEEMIGKPFEFPATMGRPGGRRPPGGGGNPPPGGGNPPPAKPPL